MFKYTNEKNKTVDVMYYDEMLALVNLSMRDLTQAQDRKYTAIYQAYLIGIKNGDDGIYGKTVEKLTRREKSHKVTVAKQGKVDATAKIDGKLIPIEVKTNGGRIDNIKTKYIVYSIRLDNSTGKCDICQRIIKVDTFMAKLKEFNAIKEVRHTELLMVWQFKLASVNCGHGWKRCLSMTEQRNITHLKYFRQS